MSSIWLCIPSIRPASEAVPNLELWKKMGYKIALLRQGDYLPIADITIPTDHYHGWANGPLNGLFNLLV